MVQILPEGGTVFGRLGKALGEGLSQTLPKEIERGRLSSGLREQAESKETNPLKRYANLMGVPGVSENPQIADQAMQYMQSQQLKDASRSGQPPGGQSSNQPQGQSQTISQPSGQPNQAMQPPVQRTEDVVQPPKFDRSASNYLVPTTAQDIDRQAADLSDQTGILFPQAQQIVQRQDEKRLQAETAYESRAELGRKELGSHVEQVLQKSGDQVFRDLTGEMLGEYQTLVDNDIANGMSPRQAAVKRGDEVLKLAKTRQQVSTEGAKSAFGSSPEKGRDMLRNARQQYKDMGRLDLYEKDLRTKVGMTPAFAASLAYPPADHKEMVTDVKASRKKPLESYEKIGQNLNKNDSLLAIALAINENGGNGQAFLQKIAADKAAGRVQLTERQGSELLDTFRPNPSLTDVWYTSLFSGHRAGI